MKAKRYLAVLLAFVMCLALTPPHIVSAEDVTFTAIAGKEDKTSEGYAKLFDGSAAASSNKWCVSMGTDGAYVIVKASKKVIVTAYTLTTGNDNASWGGRNPKSWVFSGCNDYDEANVNSGSWQAIDTRTDDTTMKDVNRRPYTFGCKNTEVYQYYKLQVSAVQGEGGEILQIGELGFTYEDPYNVSFTALDGTQTSTNEGYAKLIDGNINTKWGVSGFSSAYIVIKASKKIYVNGYAFTTGNDTAGYSGRNPKSWKLSGCNDYNESSKQGTWATIHEVAEDSVLQPVNHTKFNFDIDNNSAAYQYYLLKITANVSGEFMQLSEMEFIYDLCGHSWKTVSVEEASCTKPEYTLERCDKCGSERTTETAPALGHTEGEDGSCVRCGKKPVAIIGETKYLNAADAFAAAKSGDTITLLNDASIAAAIEVSSNITLDLNGYTLEMTEENTRIANVQKNAVFTLKDSNKTGVLTGGSSDNGGAVYIAAKGKFIMEGGTITGCKATGKGGAVYAENGNTVEIKKDAVISNCTAAKQGGGIYAEKSSNITLDGTISDCATTSEGSGLKEGGGIYLWNNGTLTMGSDAVISGCSAGDGGGIYAISNVAVNINGGTIKGCSGVDFGGGIRSDGSVITIDNGIIEDCSSRMGGAIYGRSNSGKKSTIVLKNGTSLRKNEALVGDGGGGVYLYNSTLEVYDSSISDNSAKNGGAVYISTYGGGIIMDNATIENNTATWDGGGIVVKQSNYDISIKNSRITGNIAKGEDYNSFRGGGGIVFLNHGGDKTAEISNTVISDNTAPNGGGIYSSASQINITGGSVCGNKAANAGAGIHTVNSSTLNLNETEISGNGERNACLGGGINVSNSVLNILGGRIMHNTAANGGGIYTDAGATVSLDQTTILGNTATQSGGGISCATNLMSVDGGVQIYGNTIRKTEDGDETPSNLCLNGGTKLTVTNPVSELDSGFFESRIYVTIDGGTGTGNITDGITEDYSMYFFADNTALRAFYDTEVYLAEGFTVTVDYGYGGRTEEITVPKGGTFDINEYPIHGDGGYIFGGWFADGNGYNFTKPVTQNFTLTAKWLKDGENAVSITPNKLYMLSDRASYLYICAYKDGKLTGAVMREAKAYSMLNIPDTGLDIEGADTLSAFLWDGTWMPLCEGASTKMN